jgi:hypothetical protein
MTSEPTPTAPNAANPWRTFGIIVISVVVTLAIAYWVVSAYLFPHAFTPVTLTHTEQQRLEQKLDHLGRRTTADKPLEPERYHETDANRDISFSEKELNALLAHNTDLASRVAIDLSDNLASAKILIPLDPDLPVLGGKTLKVTAGLELQIKHGQPRAILKGVSVWGVPLPNAWLGNLKNIDLMQEYGDAGGFWQAIKDGVEELEIKDGKLHIILKK